MSFLLKTNNRKYESGSTLIAKIVTPGEDKKIAYLRCPVKIQKQTISDEDAVIRDIQIIDTTLNAANDWNNITEEIYMLSDAMNSVTNGSVVGAPQISNASISQNGVNIQIISNNGNVMHRPLYDKNAETPGQKCTLSFNVSKGSITRQYTKEFTVPAYTADDILGILRNKLTANNLWSFIKAQNETQGNLVSNVLDLNAENTKKALYEHYNINLSDYVVSGSEPTLTTNFFNTSVGGLNEHGVITRPTAAEAYDASNSDNTLKPCTDNKMIVKDDVSSTLLNKLGLDSTKEKMGLTVAYRTQYNDDAKNVIDTRITLNGGSLNVNPIIENVGLISQKINLNDIVSNVSSAVRTSWLTPFFADYSLTDSVLDGVNSSSNRLQITANAGQGIVIQLPGKLTDLAEGIPDAKHIGYSVSSSGTKGFVDQFIYFVVYADHNMHVTSQTNIADITDDLTLITPTDELTSGVAKENSGIAKFLYLDSTEISTGDVIKGTLEIHCKDSVLGPGKILGSIYFELKKS